MDDNSPTAIRLKKKIASIHRWETAFWVGLGGCFGATFWFFFLGVYPWQIIFWSGLSCLAYWMRDRRSEEATEAAVNCAIEIKEYTEDGQ